MSENYNITNSKTINFNIGPMSNRPTVADGMELSHISELEVIANYSNRCFLSSIISNEALWDRMYGCQWRLLAHAY